MEGARLKRILRKAELLSGGPLPEGAAALAALAARQAMALCRREDVPEDMEGAVASLLLSLLSARGSGEGGEEGGEGEGGGDGAETALPALGAVKSIQRGDTTIVYASGSAGTAAAQAAGNAGEALRAAALAMDWSPWRRLGRLRHD